MRLAGGLWRGGLLATAATFLLAGGAEAHALVSDSDPGGGASVDAAPPAVTITFTEPPDPRLSSIHVMDSGGRRLERGPAEAVPGGPLGLRVPLGGLPNGVYTVTWRTVSRVDGHATGGSLAFGVGVPADEVVSGSATAAAGDSPPAQPLDVVGRWLFSVGIGL